MPSSSLFLRSSTTIVTVLSLFSASSSAASDNSVYTEVDTFKGNDFTDSSQFDYFSKSDPTNGFVTYQDLTASKNDGLAQVNNGVYRMAVETADLDPTGRGRKSVRIESTKTWYQGLFVADIAHMPKSICGSWPAWWLLGVEGTWPTSGEIDIMEGVSQRTQSLAALHVADVSTIDGNNNDQTGITQQNNCNYNDPAYGTAKNPTGCGVLNSDVNTFGSGVNNAGGVVTAMEWTDDFIRVWTWPRSSAPSDVLSAKPKPSTWGKPSQLFDGANANIKSRFGSQKMIFDTTFCGDWAGNTWQADGCIAATGFQTCKEYVAYRGADFADSYWDINQVKIFQKKAPVSTTSSTVSSTSTTTRSSTTASTSSVTSSVASSSTQSTLTTSTRSGTSTRSSVSSVGTTSTTSVRYGNGTTTSGSTSYTTSFNPSTSTDSTTSKSGSTTSTTKSTTSSKSQNPGQSSVTGWPNGGAPKPTGGWEDWNPVSDKPTYVTTTITKTYVVPCETGLKTETATITTSYVKGGKPYTPTAVMTTYTTTCPADWGFGGPVTVTIPITKTKTVTVNGGKPTGGNGNGNGNGASSTWSAWSSASTTSKKADPTSTWATWSSASPASTSKVPDASSTWATWTTVAASTSVKSVAQSTASADWNTWAPSATGVQGVKAFTGAASKLGSGLMGAVVAGVVGLLFL